MASELETKSISWRAWFSRNTELEAIKTRLLDEPENGFAAWARTTAGVVAFLLFLQFLTGVLLAFYYVPSVEHAYATVSFIELALPSGSWIRSLHYHSSILLPLILIAHLLQMIFRRVYLVNKTAWSFALIFLVLVLAAAATGYALPWDARAYNGVNIALSLAENTPLAGAAQRAWLQNSPGITTLTLSRFYALHAFLTPALILLCVAARLFFFGRKEPSSDGGKLNGWWEKQLARNAVSIGVVFSGLAIFSAKFSAPLAPPAREAASFLSRPGPQFLWLFELQKHLHGSAAAMVAFAFPAAIIGGLILGAFLSNRIRKHRPLIAAIFLFGFGSVALLSVSAYVQDARDPAAREQLARQQQQELEFRAAGFKPLIAKLGREKTSENVADKKPEGKTAPEQSASPETSAADVSAPPAAYKTNCAKCHGAQGEGTRLYPELKAVTTREDFRLSDEDLLQIINDAKSFGLSAKMPSFKNKLKEEEKQEIINWIKTLK